MMICDFHGHTRKRDVFMYGCSIKPETYQDIRNNLLARVAPYYLHTHNNFFSFKSSHYRVEKYKESTARIVFFKDFQIPHSYTMEASFYGSTKADSHFSPQDLGTLGKDLCRFCVAFSKDSMYFSLISSTNNYLKTLRSKQLTPRSVHKEITLSDTENKSQEKIKIVIHSPLEILEDQKEEIAVNQICNEGSASEGEDTEKIDENRFWSQVELVKCLPDVDSSGSDSDSADKIEVEEEKTEVFSNQVCITISSQVAKTPNSKTPNASTLNPATILEKSYNEELIRKSRRRSKRIPQNLSLSVNKKVNETLTLQTFQFPDPETERKSRRSFEPLKASINLKAKWSRSPTVEKKSSLTFFPAIVSTSSSYPRSNRISTLQTIFGIDEQLAKYISQNLQFKSKR